MIAPTGWSENALNVTIYYTILPSPYFKPSFLEGFFILPKKIILGWFFQPPNFFLVDSFYVHLNRRFKFCVNRV